MNKKNIILIIIFTLYNHLNSSEEIKTIMAPENGSAFIIMLDNGLNNSYIELGNSIILGDGINPITITQNNNINYPIIWPTATQINLLGINANGQIITTTSGSLTQLGENGSNFINCPKTGSITIESHTPGTGDIIFSIGSETNGNIKFYSNNINLVDGLVLVGIDKDHNIVSTDGRLVYSGDSTGNCIYIDNSPLNIENGIILDTTNGVNKNIKLITGSNADIILMGGNIDTPMPGAILYLCINEKNQIRALPGGNGGPGIFTDLSASGNVSLGSYPSSTGANILIPNDHISPISIASSSGIFLFADDNYIKLYSSTIIKPEIENPLVVLSVDSENNIVSTNGEKTYIIGNSNGNYITVDNSTHLGTTVNGSIYLQNSGFTLPGANQTAILTIDSSGKIGIQLSSVKFKKNITPLKIKESDFDSLIPYQYAYINTDNAVEFGLIAEEVKNIESLQEAFVILDIEKKPLTINYQAVLIALLEQFLTYKKNTNYALKDQAKKIEFLENELKTIRYLMQNRESHQ